MAIPTFDVDMNIISKIPEYPSDGGFNTETFRAEFDKAGLLLKDYINNILIPELDKTVDVDALLADILDSTLTKSGKAAPANIVGEKLRLMDYSYASFFNQAVKSGDYIIEADQNFRAELISATKVRVFGGKYVAQGNLVELNIGSYVDLDVQSGSVGLYRNDLICGRYQRDAEGNVTKSIVLVQGSSYVSGGVDPTVNTGDINAGGAVIHDTPLCRLRVNGASISAENVRSAQTIVTLKADGWMGESAPYTQTIAVAEMTEHDRPFYGPVYSSDHETRIAQKEAFSVVDDLDTANGSVTFTCFEDKPAVDLFVQLRR